MPNASVREREPTILSYEEVRKRCVPERSSLLLGNGFSIACDEVFSYRSLYNAAVTAGLSVRARRVFERLGTNNFEGVMRSLELSHWVAATYGLVQSSNSEMLGDLETIKRTLIEAIGGSHLQHPGEILDERKERAVEFLRQYRIVFTTNYDLLLYWITMNSNPPLFDDGFRYDPDDEDRLVFSFYSGDRRMFYLHGAVHLYMEEGRLCKHRSGTDGLCLTDVIRESLGHGQYPLFVAEASAGEKLRQINENPYLTSCLGQFNSLKGNLVILGHSLAESDEHILDAIVRNRRLSSLYLGLHGDPESSSNQVTQATARRLHVQRSQQSQQCPLEVYFYSSETACVWDNNPS
jgi:hypothetical protein